MSSAWVCKHFRGRTYRKGKGKGKGKGKKGYKNFKPYKKGGKGKGRSYETESPTDTATSYKGKGKAKPKSGKGKGKGKGKNKAAGEPDSANTGGKGPGPRGTRQRPQQLSQQVSQSSGPRTKTGGALMIGHGLRTHGRGSSTWRT